MIKLFLCNFTSFYGFIRICFYPIFLTITAAARLGRSTGRSTVAVDRRARIRARWLTHKPVDRTVDRLRAGCSRVAPGRPSGRKGQRAVALCIWVRSTARSTGSCQRSNVTVGRSTDRSTGSSFLADFAANGYIF